MIFLGHVSTTFKNYNSSLPDFKFSYNLGGTTGIRAELQLKKRWYFITGLNINLLRSNYENETTTIDGDFARNIIAQQAFKMYYLEMPFMVAYQLPVTKKMSVHFAMGAYFAYGLYGECLYDITGKQTDIQGNNLYLYEHQHMNMFDYEHWGLLHPPYGRLDAGVCAEITLSFYKYFRINVGYHFGLVNYAFNHYRFIVDQQVFVPAYIGTLHDTKFIQKNSSFRVLLGTMIPLGKR